LGGLLEYVLPGIRHVWPAHTAAGEVFRNEKKLDFFERKTEEE
jgi:hypothetical protein